MRDQFMNNTPRDPLSRGELLKAQDGGTVSSKEPPGLNRSRMEDFAVEGAKAFLPFVDKVVRWLSKQTDIDTLGPRLFDQFAWLQIPALTNELHSSMLYGSESAWTSLLKEIPGLKKVLQAADTFTPK